VDPARRKGQRKVGSQFANPPCSSIVRLEQGAGKGGEGGKKGMNAQKREGISSGPQKFRGQKCNRRIPRELAHETGKKRKTES